MSVVLPTHPAPVDAVPSYLDWGGILRPIFGGALQKLRRLGNRFSLAVTLPPLAYSDSANLGMVWVSHIIGARDEGAIMSWPQPGLEVGTPGDARMNGGGQSGSVIVLRGMTPGYVVRDGQAFSIIHGGRRYLHISRSYQLVNGAGVVILPMAPMLRVSPADGAIVEFFPKIEGLLEGDAQSWSLDVALNVGLSFTITEMR